MSLQSVYSVLYLLVTGSLFGCNIHTNVWGFFQEDSQVSPFFSSLCHTLTMRAECLRWWMIHRDRVWTLCCELLSSDSFFSRADSEKDDMPVSKWALPLWPDRLRPALTRLSPELFWRDSHCHQNWSCAANLLTSSIKLFPAPPKRYLSSQLPELSTKSAKASLRWRWAPLSAAASSLSPVFVYSTS